MNPQKHIHELSKNTRADYAKRRVRNRWLYSRLWEDSVQQLTERVSKSESKVRAEAMIAFLVAQPIMNNAPEHLRGYLVHNITGEPIDAKKLAALTNQDWGAIGRGIRELVRIGLWGREGAMFYDKNMRATDNERFNGEKSSENLANPDESQENLANPEEPSKNLLNPVNANFAGSERSREQSSNENTQQEQRKQDTEQIRPEGESVALDRITLKIASAMSCGYAWRSCGGVSIHTLLNQYQSAS